MKTIVASGYFLIYHAGHEEYLRRARELGDKLVVLLNNDWQQKLKYGKIIVPWKQRIRVIGSIKYVDFTLLTFEDWTTNVNYSLEIVSELFRNDKIIFAKGGDRNADEIPEREICKKLGIEIVDGLGKKIQSASKLLKL